MGPVFVVTSRITNEMRVQKPRTDPSQAIEWETRAVYTVGINLVVPESGEANGPGLAFQTDSLDGFDIGAKFTLTHTT